MIRKIIFVMVGLGMLFSMTGCGKKSTDYTSAIEEMRSYRIGYLENQTLGELLDIAIQDAKWVEDKDYSITSGAIVVTGKDKDTKDKVELIWLTNPDSAENGFESMTKNNSKLSYSEFLEYLKDYSSNGSSNNNDSKNESTSNYEAEDVLNSILNNLAKKYKNELTIEQLTSELNKKDYQLLDKMGQVIDDKGVLFDEDGSRIYALLEDDNGSIYSFYATYSSGEVTITQFKKEK